MNSALSDLGIVQAFDPVHADFSGMSDTEVFISSVIHKTYINVWEVRCEFSASAAVQSLAGIDNFLFFARRERRRLQ